MMIVAEPRFDIGETVAGPESKVGKIYERRWVEPSNEFGYWHYTARGIIDGKPMLQRDRDFRPVDLLAPRGMCRGGLKDVPDEAVKDALVPDAWRGPVPKTVLLTASHDAYPRQVLAEASKVIAQNGRIFKDREGGVCGGIASPEAQSHATRLTLEDAKQFLLYIESREDQRGIEPVEGTRRAVIRDAILGAMTAGSLESKLSRSRKFADAVEAALPNVLTVETQHPHLEALGRRVNSSDLNECELHVVLAAHEDRPGRRFIKIEDQYGRDLGGFERRQIEGLTHIVIPYGRDDRWVKRVAFQVAGAATRPLMEDHPHYGFPAGRVQKAVDDLLVGFGIDDV